MSGKEKTGLVCLTTESSFGFALVATKFFANLQFHWFAILLSYSRMSSVSCLVFSFCLRSAGAFPSLLNSFPISFYLFLPSFCLVCFPPLVSSPFFFLPLLRHIQLGLIDGDLENVPRTFELCELSLELGKLHPNLRFGGRFFDPLCKENALAIDVAQLVLQVNVRAENLGKEIRKKSWEKVCLLYLLLIQFFFCDYKPAPLVNVGATLFPSFLSLLSADPSSFFFSSLFVIFDFFPVFFFAFLYLWFRRNT